MSAQHRRHVDYETPMLIRIGSRGWAVSGRAYILDGEGGLDLNQLCHGLTPLMGAARAGHVVVICKMLLRAGADANVEFKGKKARDMASTDVRLALDTLNVCWTRGAHFDHAISVRVCVKTMLLIRERLLQQCASPALALPHMPVEVWMLIFTHVRATFDSPAVCK